MAGGEIDREFIGDALARLLMAGEGDSAGAETPIGGASAAGNGSGEAPAAPAAHAGRARRIWVRVILVLATVLAIFAIFATFAALDVFEAVFLSEKTSCCNC